MSMTNSSTWVVTQVQGQAGLITLNRPKALNALSLEMVRALSATLRAWAADAAIERVAIRGMSKAGEGVAPFGAFCAGGDIRFFHQAALAGNPALEDFFTEEYALNHLIHTYPKPYVALMDGIVMGGGMGISQGASKRIVTERTKMAMPETGIGLFPDVGGGYFLSRTPGYTGEYLALTGDPISGAQAVALGLADALVHSDDLPALWAAFAADSGPALAPFEALLADKNTATRVRVAWAQERIDRYFSLPTVSAIIAALQADASDEWAQTTAATLRKRSPLMLHVVLAQIRRARAMSLADDLRMERDLVRHCFFAEHLGRSAARSETVEGIRALAVDKDHHPQWIPAQIEQVTPEMWQGFFNSPWPAYAHPLRGLSQTTP